MKRIKLFPAPHMEIRIHASDQMVEDYKKCARIAKESNGNHFKDCNTCSWKEINFNCMDMCQLGELEKLLSEEG